MFTKLAKKWLGSFVAIALVLGMISVTGNSVEAYAASSSTSGLYYNNGHRDTIATSLSDAALAYYDGFAYDYADIAAGTVSASDAELKTALSNLMRQTLENQVTYSSLPTYWAYSDAEDGTAGTVYFYSDVDDKSYSASLNREHVWPKSHASFQEMYGGADLHHLRPAISTVNSFRSSYTMGEIDETKSDVKYYTINGTKVGYIRNNIFEPMENVKGDVARIFLYVYVCWNQPNLFQNVSSANLPSFDPDDSKNDGQKVIESLSTLLKWCYEDPVDTWEMEQNDIIQLVQGNRNVFIDYPEYAWEIFGLEVPSDMVSPTSGNTVVNHNYDPGDLSGVGGSEEVPTISDEEIISIKDANATNGAVVAIEGQVAYKFGTNDSVNTVILYDNAGDSMQVYFGNGSFNFEVGDIVRVKGTTSVYHGVTQIGSVTTAQLVTDAEDAGSKVQPTEITLAELAANTDSFVSKYVSVKNVVIGETSSDGKSIAVSQTIDGVTTTVDLYTPASFPSGVVETDTVDILATATKRDTTPQLRVGSSSDYTLVQKGAGVVYDLTTPEGIIKAAFSLQKGESLPEAVSLKGTVSSIKTAYSAQYKNISVYLKVNDSSILCFRLSGGEDLSVGDVITVTGTITNYNGTVEFAAGCTYVTETPAVTNTPAPTATNTPAPTNTSVPTNAPTATNTPAPTATNTPAPVEEEGTYALITTLEELGEGGKIVFYGINGEYAYALGNTVKSKKAGAVSVTIDGNTVVNPTEDVIWTVEKQEDGSYTLYNEAVGKYLVISVNNTAGIELASTPSYAFTVSVADGNFFFQTTMSGNTRGLSIYQTDFRAYAKSAAKTLNLYKLMGEEIVPTPTAAPTATSTPEPTATSTPVPTATSTPEPTATSTPVPTATSTPEPTATNTPVPTATNTPTPISFVDPADYIEGGKYVKIGEVSEIAEGGQIIIYGINDRDSYTGALGSKVTSGKVAGENVAFDDADITADNAAAVWILTPQADGNYTLYNPYVNKYLYLSADKTTSFKLSDTPVSAFSIYGNGESIYFKTTLEGSARCISPYQNDFRAYAETYMSQNKMYVNVYKHVEVTATPTPTATNTPVPTATNTPTPTATDTPVPTATNTPVPVKSDVVISTSLNNAWENFEEILVTMTNNTEATVKSWKLLLPVNGKITAVYNATLAADTADGFVISCPDWDKNVLAGESKTFTVLVEKSEETVVFGNASFVSAEVVVNAEDYRVELTTSGWVGGFNGNVNIYNNTSEVIDNWTMEFDYADEIASIWNAVIVSHEGNHYVIENAGHNAGIYTWGPVNFGFSGVPANGETSEAVFENVILKCIK